MKFLNSDQHLQWNEVYGDDEDVGGVIEGFDATNDQRNGREYDGSLRQIQCDGDRDEIQINRTCKQTANQHETSKIVSDFPSLQFNMLPCYQNIYFFRKQHKLLKTNGNSRSSQIFMEHLLVT